MQVTEKMQLFRVSGGCSKLQIGVCMRNKSKWLVRIVTLCLVFAMVFPVTAQAAAVESVDYKAVYQKQNRKGTCTLSSTAMMLRRAALYEGSEQWKNIKESTIRSTVWSEGSGLKWNFTYAGMSVKRATLPGGSANKTYLKKMLADHPEGIVLYDRSVPHAVLLTDYTDGVFYCSDPAKCVASGRVPLSQSYRVKLERASVIWYVEHQKFSVDGIRYQVLDTAKGKNEVQVIGIEDSEADSLLIPATVKFGGKSYKVTRIAENACKDHGSLVNLQIGKNVTSVASNAFAGLDDLNIMNMDVTALKDVAKNAFELTCWQMNFE